MLRVRPDGTLDPSADPVELPDPPDSGPSYWLARTVWALGEAHRAFQRDDPAFTRLLAERMDLAPAALERDVLSRYGRRQIVDGQRVPAWLIVDATAEAMLGPAAYDTPRAPAAPCAGSARGGGAESGGGWPGKCVPASQYPGHPLRRGGLGGHLDAATADTGAFTSRLQSLLAVERPGSARSRAWPPPGTSATTPRRRRSTTRHLRRRRPRRHDRPQ